MRHPRSVFPGWVFLCLLCVSSCERNASPVTQTFPSRRDAGTAEQAPEKNAERATRRLPKVVFLGDSIAAGLHLPQEHAFPAVVARRLAREGTPFKLINAGVSGDTTAGGLRRLDWLLTQSPAIIVLELGANDGLRGGSLSAIEENLGALVAKIKTRGVRVLLLGMRLPPSYGQAYADDFEAIYSRVARVHEVPFVPFFMEGVAGVPERNLPDGLHPTREGHELLAERVATALAPLVRASAERAD